GFGLMLGHSQSYQSTRHHAERTTDRNIAQDGGQWPCYDEEPEPRNREARQANQAAERTQSDSARRRAYGQIMHPVGVLARLFVGGIASFTVVGDDYRDI